MVCFLVPHKITQAWQWDYLHGVLMSFNRLQYMAVAYSIHHLQTFSVKNLPTRYNHRLRIVGTVFRVLGLDGRLLNCVQLAFNFFRQIIALTVILNHKSLLFNSVDGLKGCDVCASWPLLLWSVLNRHGVYLCQ